MNANKSGTPEDDVPDVDLQTDFKADTPADKDPDSYSTQLRALHRQLWSKELQSGVTFMLQAPTPRRAGYLVYTDAEGSLMHLGSDAITNSYTRWMRPKSLVAAIASLTDEERGRYLHPSYTIGSTMIWPVRSANRPTINQARGVRGAIADRMDLTLECIRRHYDGGESPLSDVLTAYGDFFALFSGFREFVDFFHFQDLVSPDYGEVEFFLLPFDGFASSGLPKSRDEYITYREATLGFIAKRGRRMLDWLQERERSESDAR